MQTRPRSMRLFACLCLSLASLAFSSLCGCLKRPIIVEERPAADAALASNSVRFVWHTENTSGEEFVGYHLQVATSLSFAAPVHEQEYKDPFAEVVLPPGAYYWRVKGRYRKMGDTIEETEWSDMKLVDGRYLQRARIITVLNPGAVRAAATSDAPAARREVAGSGSRAAPGRTSPGRPRRSRPGAGAVLSSHRQKPALEGIDTIGVGGILVDGEEHVPLTRELILRLYKIGRFTLLEQQLLDDGELRIPMSFLDSSGRPKELPPERTRVFVLHRHQPTPMLAADAVRLRTPDAMLMVRIGSLDFDPALLPGQPPSSSRQPLELKRFERGMRVLSATLVSIKTGIILWTASLYGQHDIADGVLVSSLVDTYFR